MVLIICIVFFYQRILIERKFVNFYTFLFLSVNWFFFLILAFESHSSSSSCWYTYIYIYIYLYLHKYLYRTNLSGKLTFIFHDKQVTLLILLLFFLLTNGLVALPHSIFEQTLYKKKYLSNIMKVKSWGWAKKRNRFVDVCSFDMIWCEQHKVYHKSLSLSLSSCLIDKKR